MNSIWAQTGVFLIAAAFLVVASKLHQSSSKHARFTKPAGVVMAFLAGCAFLATVAVDAVTWLAARAPAVILAALIIAVATIAIDWLLDGRPDRPAFMAALILPLLIIAGLSQLGTAIDQVGDGVGQISNHLTSNLS